jgi:hypothetical protein
MNNGKTLRLPGFIHVGPPRTGTTWLHEVLKDHLGLPSDKETLFFDTRYDRGIEWYSSLFNNCPLDSPLGEMGPTYFSNAIARERIKHEIPNCKIIITFREPAARLYSMYRLLRAERRPVLDTFEGHWRLQIVSGADLCSYTTQLKRWQATFGESQVLPMFYEDLTSDPQRYLDTICDFIGARRLALDRSKVGSAKVHSAVRAARLSPIARRTVEVVDWANRHGARPLIELGQKTPLWKIMRRPFVQDLPPLNPESADEVRAMVLPETEELERITARDLSRWKPRVRQTLDLGRADAGYQAG